MSNTDSNFTRSVQARTALDLAMDALTANLAGVLRQHRPAIEAAIPGDPEAGDFPSIAFMTFDAALTDALIDGGLAPVVAANMARLALSIALGAIPPATVGQLQ